MMDTSQLGNSSFTEQYLADTFGLVKLSVLGNNNLASRFITVFNTFIEMNQEVENRAGDIAKKSLT
jgi:hypothetical protein